MTMPCAEHTTLSSSSNDHVHQGQERTPLLLSKAETPQYNMEDSIIERDEDSLHTAIEADIMRLASQKGSASAKNVAINLAKTAAGTGILALPFACQQGGLLLFCFGTVLIAAWNVFALKRLCDCLELLIDVESSPASKIFARSPPPAGTATLGKVAYYALGDVGLVVLDIMLLLLLCGIVIAYEVAILSFSKGTPFTTDNNILDALILAVLLVPLCLVEDMSSLSKLSKLGLIILGFTMLVIAGYGVSGYQERVSELYQTISTDDDRIRTDDNDDDNSYDGPFHWLPDGLAGASHWFGCVVFGFGIVPLTFNFRESMAQPEQLPNTALFSMLLVAAAYVITGVALLYLYPNIEDDVLSELPEGWLATLTRLAMIVVVMATAPLLIVPCAEIIEGKIHHDGQVHPRTQLLARSALSLVTVSISVMLPGFVTVLAFVGCFSVSLVSFCVPPFLHWVLLQQKYEQHANHHLHTEDSGEFTHTDDKYPVRAVFVDVAALVAGLAITVITTFITFQKMVETGSS